MSLENTAVSRAVDPELSAVIGCSAVVLRPGGTIPVHEENICAGQASEDISLRFVCPTVLLCPTCIVCSVTMSLFCAVASPALVSKSRPNLSNSVVFGKHWVRVCPLETKIFKLV